MQGVERRDEYPSTGDTLVGPDVWIGYQATILPGVRIGNGAVVALRQLSRATYLITP